MKLQASELVVDPKSLVLVTGASGFIGARLLRSLQAYGFNNIRCLVRPSSDLTCIRGCVESDGANIEIQRGNLLSKDDCAKATQGASIIFHLAAGTKTNSFADAFVNSVVATRNLLDGALQQGCLRRFVNLSSFVVYNNEERSFDTLDESCPMEKHPDLRGDPYCFAKVKQDELIIDYGRRHHIPYVLVRPGVVYGPGKSRIHGRVGLDTFGVFLHLGGSNQLPFTHVENCADAIALAGLKKGIDGEIFNVVDDNLPSSREFLKMYKKEVRSFFSLYVPHFASYLLSLLWEKYSIWSQGQLPPIYNRKQWAAFWRQTRYSNEKIKSIIGWTPLIPFDQGLKEYFARIRKEGSHA